MALARDDPLAAGVEVNVRSLTAVADLNENPIDLHELAALCNDGKQHGGTVRMTPDGKHVQLQRGRPEQGGSDVVYGLVSATGQLKLTGARSNAACYDTAKLFTTWMSGKLGRTITFSDYRVTRAVSAADCKFRVRLEELHVELEPKDLLLFEPEVFPGLVMRAPGAHERVSVAVFASGRIELWDGGENDGADHAAAFKPTYELLCRFRE